MYQLSQLEMTKLRLGYEMIHSMLLAWYLTTMEDTNNNDPKVVNTNIFETLFKIISQLPNMVGLA